MRRAGVVAVLLVLLLVLLKACTGGSGGPSGVKSATPSSPAASPSTSDPGFAVIVDPPSALATPTVPTSTATSKPTAKPTVKATVKQARTCTDADVDVTAATDVRAYPAGSTPRFTLTVTNSSPTPCRRDLGSAALRLLVTSGPARVWSSDDCKPKGVSSLRLLDAGASFSTSLSWPRVRTNAACTGPKGQAAAGTYVLTAAAGPVTSAKATFLLH